MAAKDNIARVIAKRMRTTRTAISRLEYLGRGRYSPSIDTFLDMLKHWDIE